MKKQNRQQVRESLASALEPPRRQPPKSSMDELLERYDDGQPITPVTPVTRAAPAITDNSIENKEISTSREIDLITPITPVTGVTPVTTPTPATPVKVLQTKSLDATHTASEQQVYSVMYRMTVSQGRVERHFGPAELMRLTGIKSDKTIRKAIDGLLAKRSIEIVSYREGDHQGPKYRVFTPQQIFDLRRKDQIEIDSMYRRVISGTVTPVTGVTIVENAPVTPVENAGVTGDLHDHVISKNVIDDDTPVRRGLRDRFPDLKSDEIDRAARELEEVLWSELERRVVNANEPPVSPAYFVECVRRLCSASQRSDAERVKGRRKQATERQRAQMRRIIEQVREAHVGAGPEYTPDRFRQDVERACGRGGVVFDLDLFNEIVGSK